MTLTAIILAAGSGTRAGGALPKQLQMLAGRPVFMHSVQQFLAADPQCRIIVVINAKYRVHFEQALRGLKAEVLMVEGGSSRLESVANALRVLPAGSGLIAVHDAARPLLSTALIRRGLEAGQNFKAAVPVVPLADSIRRLCPDGDSHTVNRADFRAVQTPQVFDALILRRAYAALESAGEAEMAALTDDASVVERAGGSITLYYGDPRNFKITGPDDLRIAEALLNE